MAKRGERTYQRIPSRRRKVLAEVQQLKSFPERIDRLRREGKHADADIIERRYLYETIRRNKKIIAAAQKAGNNAEKIKLINEQIELRIRKLSEKK